MRHFSTAEKVELGAIPMVTWFAGWLTPATGVTLELGELVAGIALLILLQGFIRDLWLWQQSRRVKATSPDRHAQCMCVESAMGLTGVIAGVGLVGFGLTRPIHASPDVWATGVAATLVVGFLLKDFVFEWSPWKIYREKNHAQVIFRRHK